MITEPYLLCSTLMECLSTYCTTMHGFMSYTHPYVLFYYLGYYTENTIVTPGSKPRSNFKTHLSILTNKFKCSLKRGQKSNYKI